MKITALKTHLVELPLERPIRTAIHDIRSVGCLLVVLESDGGVTGEGLAFTINGQRIKAFQEIAESFAPQMVGRDPQFVTAIWQDIWASLNAIGQGGVALGALAAVDTACWDLVGKAAGQPLFRLFGACRDRVETYASGGLWLSYSLDELTAEAEAFLAQGFRAMKIRLGSARPEDDVARVRAVRETIGPEVALLADANQGLTPKAAIRLGRLLEEFNLAWFEEPVPTQDHRGHAQVRAALDVPIATGETEYACRGLRRMIEAGAADILMPDLQRMGGLTEFRRAAALAQAHDLPISTHIFTEQSLSIGGSAPNCISVEHMPWFAGLYREEMELEDGKLVIPERPGVGFTVDWERVARLRG